MTPLRFLLYSAMGMLDLFVLAVILSTLLQMSKVWYRDMLRIYFQERRVFMEWMAQKAATEVGEALGRVGVVKNIN